MESRALRIGLRIWVGLVLAFLFVPIALIVLYAFNRSNIESWPIPSFTLHWFSVAWHDAEVRTAFLLSVRVALVSTLIALLLGSAVAYVVHQFRLFGRQDQQERDALEAEEPELVGYAVHQFRFFGREGISFLLVLPLALPGIITGIALNSLFSFTGI